MGKKAKCRPLTEEEKDARIKELDAQIEELEAENKRLDNELREKAAKLRAVLEERGANMDELPDWIKSIINHEKID